MRDSSLQRRSDQDSKPPIAAQMLGVSCPARVRPAHAGSGGKQASPPTRRGLAGGREGRRTEEGVRGAGYRPGQQNGAEMAQAGPRRQPAHLLSSSKSHSPSPPRRTTGHTRLPWRPPNGQSGSVPMCWPASLAQHLDLLEGDLEAEGLVEVGVQSLLLHRCLLLLEPLAALQQVDLHIGVCTGEAQPRGPVSPTRPWPLSPEE